MEDLHLHGELILGHSVLGSLTTVLPPVPYCVVKDEPERYYLYKDLVNLNLKQITQTS